MKTCTRCKREHTEETLWCEPCKKSERERYHRNPEKEREQSRKYKRSNPERTRRQYRQYDLKKHYGISVEDYNRMVEKQRGLCAACEEPPEDGRPLCVDHCHTKDKVRELLCSRCNTTLGQAKESPPRLIKLAMYALRHFLET